MLRGARSVERARPMTGSVDDDPATGRHGEAHGLPFWNVYGERRRARRARQHFSLRTFRKLGRFQRRH